MDDTIVLKMIEKLKRADEMNVRQIQKHISDGQGGFCALGILLQWGDEHFTTDEVQNYLGPCSCFQCKVFPSAFISLDILLTKLNDTEKLTFKQIAEYLQKKYHAFKITSRKDYLEHYSR